MLRSISYAALAAATVGQFVAYLAEGVLGAVAVPCCDNPNPLLPQWYAPVATPAYFTVMLLPAFICGVRVSSRPILVGTIAAIVGAFLWRWLGVHILAQLFPARAVFTAPFENVLLILYDPVFLGITAISCACYGAAAAGAASAGYLLRRRAP